MILKFVPLLALFTIVFSQGKEYFSSPLNLYIADRNASLVFQQVVQRKLMIGILFTNKNCRQCYLYQAEMTNIIEKVWKTYGLFVYRAELVGNSELQEEFHIKRFPMLHFVLSHQQRYLIYQHYQILTWKLTQKIIKRLENGLKKYQISDEQSSKGIFMDLDKLYFLEEEQILQRYTFNSVFSNLPDLIFSQHKRHQALLKSDQIPQSQLDNCHIYQRNLRKCYSAASPHQVAFILSVINFEKVVQFTQKTYKSYQQLQLNQYIFIAVLDSIIKRQDSEYYLQMLNEILQRREFKSRITIFWMETGINKQKLTHLGFKQTHLPPLFAQFDLTNAPKKILTNKKNQPIFNKQAIVKFIKDIIQFDEKQEIVKWNKEILQESLQRLKIDQHYKIVTINDFKSLPSTHFILSFPLIELQLLGDNQIFYKMILNYQYLIERVNRFIDRKITVNYLTFDKYKCKRGQKHGLYFIKDQQCYEVSQNIIFQQQSTAITLQKILYLPDFFWVNEDEYEDYLLTNPQTLPIFKYHYIDI